MSFSGMMAMVVPSWMQLLVILVLVLVLFGGKGKISGLMGDLAKGIQNFRKGLKEGEEEARTGAAAIADGHSSVDVSPERKADTPRTDA